MTNEGQSSGREKSTEILRLQGEWEQADRELVAAMERRDREEVQRLRYKVSALMHDIAALRFDLMVEQVPAGGRQPGSGPGWMGMVESPRRSGLE